RNITSHPKCSRSTGTSSTGCGSWCSVPSSSRRTSSDGQPAPPGLPRPRLPRLVRAHRGDRGVDRAPRCLRGHRRIHPRPRLLLALLRRQRERAAGDTDRAVAVVADGDVQRRERGVRHPGRTHPVPRRIRPAGQRDQPHADPARGQLHLLHPNRALTMAEQTFLLVVVAGALVYARGLTQLWHVAGARRIVTPLQALAFAGAFGVLLVALEPPLDSVVTTS